jgi:putative transposase
MIAYKALLQESMAITIDAHSTNQACPMCGHTARGNRPKKGLLFVYHHCHYTLHADLISVRNITMRTVLAGRVWAQTGHPIRCP